MLTLVLCCLVINEIAHAPADPRAEYVELLHTGSSRLQLSGATLYDERSLPRPISARPLQVDPGEYIVLVQDSEAFTRRFPGVPFLQVPGWPGLNNSGDRIGIAVDGIEVDAVAYEASWGRGDASLERLDPSGPSDHRANWRPSSSTGTPGRQNSRYAPDRTPPRLIYAEVFDPDSALAVFSEPVLPASAAAFGGGLIRWETDSSAVLTGAPVLAEWTGGGSLTLEAREIQDLFGNTAPASSVEVARSPLPGEVVVSERLVRPLADPFDGRPDQVRFLELWNRSGSLLSVRGLTLTGRERDTGERPTTTIPFVPVPLESLATLVLAEDPDAARSAFLLDSSQDVRLVPNSIVRESRLTLTGRLGESLDRSAYDPDWFDPILGERGFALSRISADGTSALSWASDSRGPSPGSHQPWGTPVHAGPGALVFSEVLFHARPGQAEFIELLVRESADMNGLHLLIDRAPASPDSLRIVYGRTELQAGSLVTAVFPVSGLPAEELTAQFRKTYPDVGGILLPVVGSHTLRNTGVLMELRSGRGVVLDRVRLSPSQHAPDLNEVAGISLERVDPEGPSLEATNWVSARAAAGATPGRPYSGSGISGSDSWTQNGPALAVHPRVFDPGEGPVAIEFSPGTQATVPVHIYGRSGQRVRTLLLQAPGGLGRIYWDGRDESGRPLSPGVFVVFVQESAGRANKTLVVLARR